MSRPLFLSNSIGIEKTAATTRLEQEPEEWPSEIIQEAYKQLPWLRDFEIDVDLDRTDDARGYAVGRMLIYPTMMKKEAASKERKLLSVPIIIREREMSPLDVFMHEKVAWPMDEDRIQGIMFNPNAFIGPARRDDFGETNLAGQVRPPADGQQMATGGALKTASQRSRTTVLEKMAHTFAPGDISEFRRTLQSDGPLRTRYLSSPVLGEATRVILTTPAVKTASEVADHRRAATRPTVVQIQHTGQGYTIKTANHYVYNPVSRKAVAFEVQAALSGSDLQRLHREGRVTFVVDPLNGEDTVEKVAQVANDLGVFLVTVGGREFEGIVVPASVDFEGRVLPQAVFASSHGHAIQEKIAGVRISDANLPDLPVRGPGVFVHRLGRRAMATEPVIVDHEVWEKVGEDRAPVYLARRFFNGERLRITKVAGLQQVTRLEDGNVMIPDTLQFLPLGGRLMSVPDNLADAQGLEAVKIASSASVRVISDGSAYSFRGADVFPDIYSETDAEFALCVMGLTPRQAQGIMKTASVEGQAWVQRTRKVIPEDVVKLAHISRERQVRQAQPTVPQAKLFREMAILAESSKDKTASVILSKETVDTVLSLGFMTPENMSIYTDFISEFEKTSSKLAEVLVASRLGMDDVREAAAKNAMSQVASVIKGLQTLRSRIT